MNLAFNLKKYLYLKQKKFLIILISGLWLTLGIASSSFTLKIEEKDHFLKNAQIEGILDRDISINQKTIKVAEKFWGDVKAKNKKFVGHTGLIVWGSRNFSLAGNIKVEVSLKFANSTTQQMLQHKGFNAKISKIQKLINDNKIINATLIRGFFTGKVHREKIKFNFYPLLVLSGAFLVMVFILIYSFRIDAPHFLTRLFLFFSAGAAADFSIMPPMIHFAVGHAQPILSFVWGVSICWFMLAVVILTAEDFVRLVTLTESGSQSLKFANIPMKIIIFSSIFGLFLFVTIVTLGLKKQHIFYEEYSTAINLILIFIIVFPLLFRAVSWIPFAGIVWFFGFLMFPIISSKIKYKKKKLLKLETFFNKYLYPHLVKCGLIFFILFIITLIILVGINYFIAKIPFDFILKYLLNFFMILLIIGAVFSSHFIFKKIIEKGFITIDLFRSFVSHEIKGLIFSFFWIFVFVTSFFILPFFIIPQLLSSGVAVPGSPYSQFIKLGQWLFYEVVPVIGPPIFITCIIVVLVMCTWFFAFPYLRLFGVRPLISALIAFFVTWGIQELSFHIAPFFSKDTIIYIIASFSLAMMTYISEKKKTYLLQKYRKKIIRCPNLACKKLVSKNFQYCPFCGRKLSGRDLKARRTKKGL